MHYLNIMVEISALEVRHPTEFVREVEEGVLDYYVHGLNGLYLPDDFRAEHANDYGVEYWKPRDRLLGKFGRFVISKYTYNDEEEPLIDDEFTPVDIIVMGTTIGLGYNEYRRRMNCLVHYDLGREALIFFKSRSNDQANMGYRAIDYGSTEIKLNEAGEPASVSIYSQSYDFGRADTDGRSETCRLFQVLLGGAIKVVNVDPQPRVTDQIIR
jgi:hypothetical protein